ncbi:hypothetical protein PpBr36_04195 [Pyricularia pennisetigena]|uniref:hypothetical protein n=1 Tax=Pyricularia pennisetigena TaxID=1578925 RepID=UPI0011514A62|nr:hypothetical protein PpBr36_04195 [Pyricularia pennisetigena]TLS26471.1 hypothetical protein PpBr36_04195 [Pyricularia pennisetigena]
MFMVMTASMLNVEKKNASYHQNVVERPLHRRQPGNAAPADLVVLRRRRLCERGRSPPPALDDRLEHQHDAGECAEDDEKDAGPHVLAGA